MKTIREQAESMGHPVVGTLKRQPDDVFKKKGLVMTYRLYADSEGTLYAANLNNELVYIAGEN